MDEENINREAGFDPNRPRLKKIKRPVKRIIPVQGGGAQPIPAQQNPFSQNNALPQTQFSPVSNTFNAPQTRQEPADFDLDDYLDGPENSAPRPQRYSSEPRFIDDDDIAAENYVPPSVMMIGKKTFIFLCVGILLLGFVFTKLFFSEEKVVRNGLQGVVINPEVPMGRARCGIAEKTQGCVLYIMNPQRQELNARDFYDLASQLTGRQRFVIETGNMRYSNTKIRPGDIGQFNIPPL